MWYTTLYAAYTLAALLCILCPLSLYGVVLSYILKFKVLDSGVWLKGLAHSVYYAPTYTECHVRMFITVYYSDCEAGSGDIVDTKGSGG